MEGPVTGLAASLGWAVLSTTQLAFEAKTTQPRVLASTGWNQGDLILLSRSAPVEGDVMLLSIPGDWQFSWGVQYPRCSAFPSLLSPSWQHSPFTPAPLRLNVGLRRHREEGSEFRAHDIGQGQMTQLSPFIFPI